MKWSEMHLEELGTVARGRSRHRPRDAAHLYDGPYPFVQTGDIKAAELYLNHYSQTYSEAGLEQSRLWPAGTLCITIAANIAETAILGIDACFPDSIIGFTASITKADVRFIKYKFDTIKRQYQQVSQGATQDNLSLEKLLSFTLAVPPLDEQRRIVEVLTAYDELMENNRRRMGLLEEAARQLYAEWFARLRYPGHARTRCTDGLPNGWTRRPLGEVCAEIRDAATPDDCEPDSPYIGLEHIPRRSIALSEWGRAEEVTSTKHRFRAGDILFGKIRPYFHKVGVAFVDGVASSDAIVLRPTATEWHSLALLTVSSDAFVADASKTAREGSKMPRADWKLMRTRPVAVPPDALLRAFNTQIEPVVAQLKTLTFQTQKLRTARDLLLPRLMNGEIQL